MTKLPLLYPIVDASRFGSVEELLRFAQELAAGGCTLLQYRNKTGGARQMAEHARALRERLPVPFQLIMNDRPDLAQLADFDGVHLGQDDLPPQDVRRIIGTKLWLGVSTHNPGQVTQANETSANYIAVGPVFLTSSKNRPDPVVGLEGVRHARTLTQKPLVAIGGITRANCHSVIEAGADSVAVISDLLPWPREAAEDFFRILG
jgi:thiamine-phosphate pyrophosphorylase